MSNFILGMLLASSLVTGNITGPCEKVKVVGTNCTFCGEPSETCFKYLPEGCYKCPPPQDHKINHKMISEFDLGQDQNLIEKNGTIHIPNSMRDLNLTVNEGFDFLTAVWIVLGTATVVLFIAGFIKRHVLVKYLGKWTGCKAFSELEEVLKEVIQNIHVNFHILTFNLLHFHF